MARSRAIDVSISARLARVGGLSGFASAGLALHDIFQPLHDGPAGLRRERVDLALERRHAIGRSPLAERDHHQADNHDADADQYPDHGRADSRLAAGTSGTSSMGCAPVPQSTPSLHVSRFRIGADDLSVSMANLAASNASPRWGAETAVTTADSPTANEPTRCNRAIRPIVGHRRLASAAISANRRITASS